MTNCEIKDCDSLYYAKGFCERHYMRNLRTGHPLTPDQRSLRPVTLVERFEHNVPDRPDEGCWLYTGTRQKGYGVISAGRGVRLSAHRVAYELWVGPIPDGLTIDHECHNEAYRRGECPGGFDCVHRACCNPAHLVPRTSGDNMRRGAAMEKLRAGHARWLAETRQNHDEPE